MASVVSVGLSFSGEVVVESPLLAVLLVLPEESAVEEESAMASFLGLDSGGLTSTVVLLGSRRMSGVFLVGFGLAAFCPSLCVEGRPVLLVGGA